MFPTNWKYIYNRMSFFWLTVIRDSIDYLNCYRATWVGMGINSDTGRKNLPPPPSPQNVPKQGTLVLGLNSQTPLIVISGTLTAQRYDDDFLQPVMLPLLLRYSGLIFQLNYSRPLTTRIATNCHQAFPTLSCLSRLISFP